MLEVPEIHNFDHTTPEELGELIAELVSYRDRLETETLVAAQKAKVTKQQATAHIAPILDKLNHTIGQLQARYSSFN